MDDGDAAAFGIGNNNDDDDDNIDDNNDIGNSGVGGSRRPPRVREPFPCYRVTPSCTAAAISAS